MKKQIATIVAVVLAMASLLPWISAARLAACYHSMGRTSEASPLALRALAIQEKLLGPRHPDLGLALANLAVLRKSLGQLAEAESCGRRALAILEETLGSGHPGTQACRANQTRVWMP